MRRELRNAAEATGDELPGDHALSVMIFRWENNRSGVSERYRLHYCRAFSIPPASFGDAGAQTVPYPHCPGPDDMAASEQTSEILSRLFTEPLAITPGADLRADLRAAVRHLRDPANRDELIFLLGYASALSARPTHHDSTT